MTHWDVCHVQGDWNVLTDFTHCFSLNILHFPPGHSLPEGTLMIWHKWDFQIIFNHIGKSESSFLFFCSWYHCSIFILKIFFTFTAFTVLIQWTQTHAYWPLIHFGKATLLWSRDISLHWNSSSLSVCVSVSVVWLCWWTSESFTRLRCSE